MANTSEDQKRQEGLYPKYVVWKLGSPPDPYPVQPVKPCFVLRYDRDPHARVALLAYADSVKAENPELAVDLYLELGRTKA